MTTFTFVALVGIQTFLLSVPTVMKVHYTSEVSYTSVPLVFSKASIPDTVALSGVLSDRSQHQSHTLPAPSSTKKVWLWTLSYDPI